MSHTPEDQQQPSPAADRPSVSSSPRRSPMELNLNRSSSANTTRDRLISSDEITLNSFPDDQRFIRAASWEDSFDASEVGGGSGSGMGLRPSSRAKNDRRKQFDTTTPTLIDEEDDEETVLKLRAAGSAQRTVSSTAAAGSLYQSTLFQPTADEAAMIAGLRNSSNTADSSSLRERPVSVVMTTGNPASADADVKVSHSYARTRTASVSTDSEQQRSLAWENYPHSATSPQSTASLASQTNSSPVRPAQGPFSFAGPWGSAVSALPSAVDSANAPADSGARLVADNTSTTTTAGGDSRASGGAFSPSILRLTEDIGILLHEDDPEDDFALDIPSVFRGGNNSNSGERSNTQNAEVGINSASEITGNIASSTNDHNVNDSGDNSHFDWTGSFVYDSTDRRTRRAIPSRGSLAAGKAGSRRREQFRQYQHLPSSGFVPYAQQPKPRRNEAFEFGKQEPSRQNQESQNLVPSNTLSRSTLPDEHRASPHLLSFGGAFAPPASGTGGFSRPVPSFQEAISFSSTPVPQFGASNQSTQAFVLPSFGVLQQQRQQLEMSRPRFSSLPSSDLMASGNLSSQPGLRDHAQSFDSYQTGPIQSYSLSEPNYAQQFQLPAYPPGFMLQDSHPPTFQQQPQQEPQKSEMHPTAQVFVPHSTRVGTPPFPMQHQDWYPNPSGAPPPGHAQQHQEQIGVPLSHKSGWNSAAVEGIVTHSYPSHPDISFAYGSPMPPNFDPRACMTPPPIHRAQPWHPLSPQLPPSQQQRQSTKLSQPVPTLQSQVPESEHELLSGTNPTASPLTDQQQITVGSQTQQNAKSSSPHPSISSAEHSGAPQRASKKDAAKRKQRAGSKKKTGKVEPPLQQQPLSSSGTALKKILPDLGSTPSRTKSGGVSEGLRPGSTTLSQEGNDDLRGAGAEEGDHRRMDLVESPATRVAFKEFYRTFRAEERVSFQRAEVFAVRALEDESLPESVHWRVYLELADLAKRSNRYAEARLLYEKVCRLQPYASQGWLEYSKLEEECGRMNRVMNILYKGLDYCHYSENLLNRALKHQEKLGNLDNARGILARLKHVGIEKVWRTVLEGALLEARAGNVATARRVLKYLMHHIPWYGPLYLEAYRLEKDQDDTIDALQVVERGLRAIPRYGPLWFGAFRLCEQIDISKRHYHLPSTMAMIGRAISNISKELVWKVHLDAAQMLERAALAQATIENPLFDALLEPARLRYATTILTCPNNLRWKVWLAAARMELGVSDLGRARSLFQRAHQVVSKKGRSSTLLECARLEEFTGNTDVARAILCKGRALYGSDWKVWLESVALEIRSREIAQAVHLCSMALETHQGTGRLWATLVQLRHFQGRDEAQLASLKCALAAVPKSGEVWCEGGRVHLNPFSDTFDLGRARRHLYFATRFTPQYGDGFVEMIRLELVDQWLSPIASYIWDKTKGGFVSRRGGSDDAEGGLITYITDVALAISVARQNAPEKGETKRHLPKLAYFDIVEYVRDRLQPESFRSTTDLTGVRLACINADPNYGLLWFHCRQNMTDSPRRIIEDATEAVATELQKYAHLYIAAMLRRKAVLSTISLEKPAGVDVALETSDSSVIQWEDFIDKQLHAAPSLVHMFNPTDPTTGMVLLENTMVSGPLFATGLTELNRHQPIMRMSLTDRKRVLFGNEALFP